jgi:hypothetical protein
MAGRRLPARAVREIMAEIAGKRLVTARAITLGPDEVLPAGVDVTALARGWANLALYLRRGDLRAEPGKAPPVVEPASAPVVPPAPSAPLPPLSPTAALPPRRPSKR